MKTPVSVKVHSVIRSEGEPSPCVTTVHTEGELDFAEKKTLLTYSDKSEGGETFTRLSVSKDSVRLSLRGGSVCELYFGEGAEYDTVYGIGGFSFDAHVKSESPAVRLSERGGEIRLGYEMTLGGDPRRVKLLISVSPKDQS